MINNLCNNFINDLLTVGGIFVGVILLVFIFYALINAYKWSIKRVDKLSGEEFESLLKEAFEILGYTVETTKKSGDQGIDLIMKKRFRKIGAQVKRYSGTVGNSAVQEAVAGKKYYKLDRVWVITNSTFTKSAKELAQTNGVELFERKDVIKLLKKAKAKRKKR